MGWFGCLQRCYSYGVEECASGSCGHVIGQVTGNCPHKHQFNAMWYLVAGGCMGNTPVDGVMETMAKVAVGPLHLGRLYRVWHMDSVSQIGTHLIEVAKERGA
jgi:hypothetical protein